MKNKTKKLLSLLLSAIMLLHIISVDSIVHSQTTYTNLNEFLREVDDIYLNQRELRESSYFRDDLYYQNVKRIYQVLARLFPADFAPSKDTWSQKSKFTTAKKQFATALAIKIEEKRKSMPDDYFSKVTIDTLLSRYFPDVYKNSTTDREKLQNFLYYFGIVDAYYNHYLNVGTKTKITIDTFIQDMAEPMYYMLEFYEKRVFNETMLNKLRNEENADIKIKVETKTEAVDNAYYTKRNRKIMEDMKERIK